MIDLIDFNGISDRLGLFYAGKLGNHINSKFFCLVVVTSFKIII